MPELPEVETTRRALMPHVVGQKIHSIIINNPHLRYLVDERNVQHAVTQSITSVQRRSKYLILQTPTGFLLSHLGMSGYWSIMPKNSALMKHDHIQINFADFCIRYNDARRFGSFQWYIGMAQEHEGFEHLGVEPVENPHFDYGFTAKTLKQLLAHKKTAIKPALMDARGIVGVGNIYANEALFMAGIKPQSLAHRISLMRLGKLSEAIVSVLEAAIKSGGTTLKDFMQPDHKTGYFQLSLNVYGRDGEPCKQCQTSIKKLTQAQRSTFYCPTCQT